MKFLKKLKSSNFWVSMISAVVLILQAVFNVEIKTEYLNQIIMSILGLLVMSGIVTDTANDEVTVKQNVDIDGIKQNVTEIISQATQALENNIAALSKQFGESAKIVAQPQAEITKTEIVQGISEETPMSEQTVSQVDSNQTLLEQVIIQPSAAHNTETQNM